MKKICFFVMIHSVFILFHWNLAFAEPSEYTELEDQGRYKLLYSDEMFDYFIDRRTAHRIEHPYLEEKLFDVWIKQKENDSAIYTYPEAYVLKHYYVRINQPELQLVQTLHWRGDEMFLLTPERPYREKNWVNTIPSSVEEALYHAIIKEMVQRSKIK